MHRTEQSFEAPKGCPGLRTTFFDLRGAPNESARSGANDLPG